MLTVVLGGGTVTSLISEQRRQRLGAGKYRSPQISQPGNGRTRIQAQVSLTPKAVLPTSSLLPTYVLGMQVGADSGACQEFGLITQKPLTICSPSSKVQIQ